MNWVGGTGLVQFIDEELGPCNAHNNEISHGECGKIVILNGLGFVSSTLYPYSEPFEDRPLQTIVIEGVLADHYG